MRLVGVGAPEYPARVNKVPLVSWVAAKQLMQFAEASDTLFRTAFQGVDVVHVYMPFKFGRRAAKVAHQMGIPVTAGFHLQPENVLYSAGPLRHIPGISSFLYWLFKHWLYKRIDHIHVPTEMTASLLRAHGYKAKLHVISNGYSPVYSPKKPVDPEASAPVPFRVIASGRLASEKDQITLIKAVSMSKHAGAFSSSSPVPGRSNSISGSVPVVCWHARPTSAFTSMPICRICCVRAICSCTVRLPTSNR